MHFGVLAQRNQRDISQGIPGIAAGRCLFQPQVRRKERAEAFCDLVQFFGRRHSRSPPVETFQQFRGEVFDSSLLAVLQPNMDTRLGSKSHNQSARGVSSTGRTLRAAHA